MKIKILLFLGIFLCGTLFFAEGSSIAAGVIDFGPKTGVQDPDIRNRTPNVYVKICEGKNATECIRDLFYANLVPLFVYLMGFVAVLLWLIYVATMITAGGDEEKISDQRKNMMWGIMGFILVLFAVELGDALNPVGNEQDIVNIDETEHIGQKIVGFLQMSLSIIALVTIFYAGVNFVRSQGIEEEIEKSKKYLQWGILGLFIAILAAPLVNTVFYPVTIENVDPALGPDEINNLASEFTGFLKFLLTFLGIGAFMTFIIAGAYYITSFGNDERQGKARSIMIGTAIGIIIILSSYAIVALFIPN